MEQLTRDELVLINNIMATVKAFSAQEVESTVKPLLTKLRMMIEDGRSVNGEVIETN